MRRLPEVPDARRAQARGWLALATAALGLSALFALLLVLSRAPWISAQFPGVSLFRRALVLHVDLSVLVWFLSCAALLWSALGLSGGRRGWRSCLAGTVLMVSAPWFPSGTAVLGDYVPVLLNLPFLVGLGMFAVGAATAAMQALVGVRADGERRLAPASVAAAGVAVALLLALLTLLLAAWRLPGGLSPEATAIALAWGAGHVLQFAYALLLATCWLLLLAPGGHRRWHVLLLAGLLPALAGPLLYLAPLDAVTREAAFRLLMMGGGWIPGVPLALFVLYSLARGSGVRREAAALPLALSAALFLLGITFGLLIRDNSVMVPAHYHGTVGAVTLALMTTVWHLLPELGLAPVRTGWVRLQALCYGGGLLLLISGLAWSGWHGTPRKVPGTEGLGTAAESIAGMALMGLGGLAAIIGVLLFVVPVLWRLAGRTEQRKGGRQSTPVAVTPG